MDTNRPKEMDPLKNDKPAGPGGPEYEFYNRLLDEISQARRIYKIEADYERVVGPLKRAATEALSIYITKINENENT